MANKIKETDQKCSDWKFPQECYDELWNNLNKTDLEVDKKYIGGICYSQKKHYP